MLNREILGNSISMANEALRLKVMCDAVMSKTDPDSKEYLEAKSTLEEVNELVLSLTDNLNGCITNI